MILELIKFNNPILKQFATEYLSHELDDAIKLSTDLFDTVQHYDGIGLAAPQIGISKRLFVISIDGVNKVFINPVILYSSPEMSKQPESCLSIPGLELKINRSVKITASWIDENKEHKIAEMEELWARVFSHEFDHLNGILIDNKVSKLVLDMTKKRLIKQIKRKYS